MTKYFVFDTETGGKKTRTSLLSMYGILTDEHFNEYQEGRIGFKIKPNDGVYNIDIEALKINSIDLFKHDAEAKPISQVKTEFRDWLSRCMWSGEKIIAVGQCVDFDINFINQYLMPVEEWNTYFEKRHIDTASVALFLQHMGLLPKHLNCSLASLAEHFNLGIKTNTMHDAKVDAEVCLEVWKRMNYLISQKSVPLV